MYYTSKTKDVDAIKSLLPKKTAWCGFLFFPTTWKAAGSLGSLASSPKAPDKAAVTS